MDQQFTLFCFLIEEGNGNVDFWHRQLGLSTWDDFLLFLLVLAVEKHVGQAPHCIVEKLHPHFCWFALIPSGFPLIQFEILFEWRTMKSC